MKTKTTYILSTNKLLAAVRKQGRRTPFKARELYPILEAKDAPAQGMVCRRLAELATTGELTRIPGAQRNPFYVLNVEAPKFTSVNGTPASTASDRLGRIEAAVALIDEKLTQLLAMWS